MNRIGPGRQTPTTTDGRTLQLNAEDDESSIVSELGRQT